MPIYNIANLSRTGEEQPLEITDENYGDTQQLIANAGTLLSVDYVTQSPTRVVYFIPRDNINVNGDPIRLDQAFRVLSGATWMRRVKDPGELEVIAFECLQLSKRPSPDDD